MGNELDESVGWGCVADQGLWPVTLSVGTPVEFWPIAVCVAVLGEVLEVVVFVGVCGADVRTGPVMAVMRSILAGLAGGVYSRGSRLLRRGLRRVLIVVARAAQLWGCRREYACVIRSCKRSMLHLTRNVHAVTTCEIYLFSRLDCCDNQRR